MNLLLPLLAWAAFLAVLQQTHASPLAKRICYPVRSDPSTNNENSTLPQDGKTHSPTKSNSLIKKLCYPVTDESLQMLTRHQFELLNTNPLTETQTEDHDAPLRPGKKLSANPKQSSKLSTVREVDKPKVRELDRQEEREPGTSRDDIEPLAKKRKKNDAKRICYWVTQNYPNVNRTKPLPKKVHKPAQENATTPFRDQPQKIPSVNDEQSQKLVKMCYPVTKETLEMLRNDYPLEASTLHKKLNDTDYFFETEDEDFANMEVSVSAFAEDIGGHMTVEWTVTNASALQFEVR